jgi:hypothetical protein
MLEQPKQVTAIYDNGGKTTDRYTFITEKTGKGALWEHLGTCYNGRAFSQWGECTKGRHLGRKVEWSSLDPELQRHVTARMKG